MQISKTKIDKSGQLLSNEGWTSDVEYIQMDDVFNYYRMLHLLPLTEVTLKLQEWLTNFSKEYYIAQRLKRRPQILRKLTRFSVRLTQLQDIGGCRIIVENDYVVDELLRYIQEKLIRSKYFKVKKITDYREKGRDDSGYRAVHIIIERGGCVLEIQIRSKIQHYWAESIERTSVIYGYRLKELEGDECVLNYFKTTSDVFYEIENGRKPTASQIEQLDSLRERAEEIISSHDINNVRNSKVNENYIKSMVEKDSKLRSKFHNWMLIFNWNTGNFESWSLIERNPEKANEIYKENEKRWSSDQGYEVVMIGSSDASTIRHTHSHYFGIETYDKILEDIDESILNFEKRNSIDELERSILYNLIKRDCWGVKKVAISTVKNHYCKGSDGFEDSIRRLSKQGYIILDNRKGHMSLNIKKKVRIESFI